MLPEMVTVTSALPASTGTGALLALSEACMAAMRGIGPGEALWLLIDTSRK